MAPVVCFVDRGEWCRWWKCTQLLYLVFSGKKSLFFRFVVGHFVLRCQPNSASPHSTVECCCCGFFCFLFVFCLFLFFFLNRRARKRRNEKENSHRCFTLLAPPLNAVWFDESQWDSSFIVIDAILIGQREKYRRLSIYKVLVGFY